MDEKNKALYYCVQCHKERVLVEGTKCLNCLSKELKEKLDNAVTYTEKDKYRQELEKIDDLIVKQKKIQAMQNIKGSKLNEQHKKENSIVYDDFSNNRIMCSECGLLEVKSKGDKCIFCQMTELRKKSKLSKQNHKDEEAEVYDLEYLKLGEKLEEYRSKLEKYASDKNEPYANEYKKALNRVNDMLSAFIIKKSEEEIKNGSKKSTTAKYLCQYCHSAMVENGGVCPKCYNKNGALDNIDSVVKNGQVRDYFKNKYEYEDNSIGDIIEKASQRQNKKVSNNKNINGTKEDNKSNASYMCSKCGLLEVSRKGDKCILCKLFDTYEKLADSKSLDERIENKKNASKAFDVVSNYHDEIEKKALDVSNPNKNDDYKKYIKFVEARKGFDYFVNTIGFRRGNITPENAFYLCKKCHKNFVVQGKECPSCHTICVAPNSFEDYVKDEEVRKYYKNAIQTYELPENKTVSNDNRVQSINGYKLCPICHMNYIPVNQSCCKICRWSKANIDDARYPNPNKSDKKVEKITNENIAKAVADNSSGNASKMKMVNGKLMEVHSIETNRKYDFEKMTSMQRAYLSVKGKSYKNYLSLMRNKEQMENGVASNGKKIEGNLLKAFQINTSKMEAKKKALDKTRWNLARVVYSEQSRAKKKNYADYQYIRDSAMANIFKYHKSRMNKG